VDDSRKLGKPMEMVLGKKFKLEVWEVIVQMMALNEVATFTVDKSVSIWWLYCHLSGVIHFKLLYTFQLQMCFSFL
jgi:hypothetical protein